MLFLGRIFYNRDIAYGLFSKGSNLIEFCSEGWMRFLKIGKLTINRNRFTLKLDFLYLKFYLRMA